MTTDGHELLFDTHAHLTENNTAPAEYLTRALNAGVGNVLFCASDYMDSKKCAAFAAASEHFFFAAGVHPHEAEKMTGDFNDFHTFTRLPRLAALGELGLDYFYGLSARDTQKHVFQGFLNLALDMHLPAIVHCRDRADSDDAYRDAYSLLQPFAEHGGSFVLHAFAGTPAWMDRFLQLGSWFGAGGMMTFKRAENIRETVAVIPLEKILLETDSPYLTPVPHRGETNHPSFLPLIAEKLASLRGRTIGEITKITSENARNFLRLEQKTA